MHENKALVLLSPSTVQCMLQFLRYLLSYITAELGATDCFMKSDIGPSDSFCDYRQSRSDSSMPGKRIILNTRKKNQSNIRKKDQSNTREKDHSDTRDKYLLLLFKMFIELLHYYFMTNHSGCTILWY